ncbi:unnamed protein product [Caenorhabditis nigoni]
MRDSPATTQTLQSTSILAFQDKLFRTEEKSNIIHQWVGYPIFGIESSQGLDKMKGKLLGSVMTGPQQQEKTPTSASAEFNSG